jgi:hypothetical protein
MPPDLEDVDATNTSLVVAQRHLFGRAALVRDAA